MLVEEVLEKLAVIQCGRLVLSDRRAEITLGDSFISIVIELDALARDLPELAVGAAEVFSDDGVAIGVASLLDVYLQEVAPLGPRPDNVVYSSFGFSPA